MRMKIWDSETVEKLIDFYSEKHTTVMSFKYEVNVFSKIN